MLVAIGWSAPSDGPVYTARTEWSSPPHVCTWTRASPSGVQANHVDAVYTGSSAGSPVSWVASTVVPGARTGSSPDRTSGMLEGVVGGGSATVIRNATDPVAPLTPATRTW